MGGQRWETKWVRAVSLLDTQECDHGHHGREKRHLLHPQNRGKRLLGIGYGRKRKQRLCSAITGVCGLVGRRKDPEISVFNPSLINTWGVQHCATSTLTNPVPPSA